MEGTFIALDINDIQQTPLAAFSFIDRLINYDYKRIAIIILDPTKQKQVEEWLVEQHKPMLVHLTIKSVIVTNAVPATTIAYISSRAIRFTNWLDIERYFI
jgi:hypothetical protein